MLTGPAGIVYKHFEKIADPRANRGPTHNLHGVNGIRLRSQRLGRCRRSPKVSGTDSDE